MRFYPGDIVKLNPKSEWNTKSPRDSLKYNTRYIISYSKDNTVKVIEECDHYLYNSDRFLLVARHKLAKLFYL
jgi:hypothetical protein